METIYYFAELKIEEINGFLFYSRHFKNFSVVSLRKQCTEGYIWNLNNRRTRWQNMGK